ncbi:MAG: hypothetical protein ABI843_09435 [Dokdonella sp.]
MATLFAANGASATILHAGPDCPVYQDIQSAIDASSSNDIVAIEPGAYTDQSLLVTQDLQVLTIAGGYPCDSDTPVVGASTILSGDSNLPVLWVRGDGVNVFVNDLIVTLGSPGVNFNGSGYLSLTNTKVNTNNRGISFRPSGAANLILYSGTLISGNHFADVGGGVYVSSIDSDGEPVRFYMTPEQTAITFNSADNGGGGLAVDGVSARADLGSPGYHDGGAFFGAISNNQSALNGAGIAISGGAVVRLFSTKAGEPVRIEGNGSLDGELPSGATKAGGGVFIDSGGLCGWGYSISRNKARVGSAISSLSSGSSSVQLFRHEAIDVCGPESATVLGAVDCKEGELCNHIDDNRNQPGFNDFTGEIDIRSGFFDAERLVISGNAPATALFSIVPSTLLNCALVGNTVDMSLIQNTDNSSRLVLDGCTIAGNVFTTANTGVVDWHGDVALSRSLLWQPAQPIITNERQQTSSAADMVVSSDLRLPTSTHVTIVHDPDFVDAAGGDYQLRQNSPAVDYAQLGLAGEADVIGHLRGFNATHRTDNQLYDVGAYEYVGDGIFADGFER